MPKIALLSITLSALIFAGLIPVLEINDTHLTNPEWPAHARLHEAWQLITNAAIAILAAVFVWNGRAPRIGFTLALIISLSFLMSWAMGGAYGGSMLHTDGTQMAVAGMNAAVLVVLILTALLLIGYRAVSKQGEAVT